MPRKAARRTADALRHDADLAEMAREEREDSVGLTEVEGLEDYRLGPVCARSHELSMVRLRCTVRARIIDPGDHLKGPHVPGRGDRRRDQVGAHPGGAGAPTLLRDDAVPPRRSEERRVGKECR